MMRSAVFTALMFACACGIWWLKEWVSLKLSKPSPSGLASVNAAAGVATVVAIMALIAFGL